MTVKQLKRLLSLQDEKQTVTVVCSKCEQHAQHIASVVWVNEIGMLCIFTEK